MKYILIIGSKNSGKSTTMNAVCDILKPSKKWRLHTKKKTIEIIDETTEILNGTYIINVGITTILVVAGSPTEQGVRITDIIQICVELNVKIDYALVSMRSYEKTEGFNTKEELVALGECIFQERIYIIEGDYEKSEDWRNRISKIASLLLIN